MRTDSVRALMRIGNDAHVVERDGTGNCTYMRGLLQGLARVDPTNDYVVYGTDLGHPSFDTLRGLHRFELRGLWLKAAPQRIPIALAVCAARDRLDMLDVQYSGPPWGRQQ